MKGSAVTKPMPASAIAVAQECTKASDEARITFPEVVGKLMEAGIERYHADLLREEKTYYMRDGASHAVPTAPFALSPARAFSAEAVNAAVRASQAGQITYKQFCERIAAAGCVDYIVSFPGRRAIYFGRTGENHVEHFPGAT
jgi:uncharacterized protein YbcV (DUF1398 family)